MIVNLKLTFEKAMLNLLTKYNQLIQQHKDVAKQGFMRSGAD